MTAAARTVNTKRGVRPGSVSASARTPEDRHDELDEALQRGLRVRAPGDRERGKEQEGDGRDPERGRENGDDVAPHGAEPALAGGGRKRQHGREDDHQRRRAVGDRHDQRHRRENDRGGMPQRQGAGARGRDGRRNGGHAGANLVPSKPWRPIHKGVRCGPGKLLVCCRPRRPGTLASARSGPGPSRVAGGASSVTPSFG